MARKWLFQYLNGWTMLIQIAIGTLQHNNNYLGTEGIMASKKWVADLQAFDDNQSVRTVFSRTSSVVAKVEVQFFSMQLAYVQHTGGSCCVAVYQSVETWD